MTINRKTANLLERVAAVFRVKEGNSFRSRAYSNAATAIENLPEPIDQLWRQDKLDTVPGVGSSIKSHLEEYFSTGHVKHFDRQLAKVPTGMFSLMAIRGVGPITAYKIAKKFNLKDEKGAVGKLKKLLQHGQLSQIKSFKEKSVVRLSSALKNQNTDTNRILLSEALAISDRYANYLNQSPDILVVEPLGSLRRRLPTVGDIDIAICTKHLSNAMSHALKFPEVTFIISQGDKVSRVKLVNGLEVDIKLSLPDAWGSLLQHYTGSKQHNIYLRTLALDKSLSLSEYGIKDHRQLHKFRSEKEFYKFLGLSYIPPEIREDGGEIELAAKNMLPKLIQLKDIRGDLHVHSDFHYPSSHDMGDSSLVDLLTEAATLGYEYIGLSDHNPKFLGLSESNKLKILTKRKEYLMSSYQDREKFVKKRQIKLLIGMEVDIRPNGQLALSDSLMSSLDYAIVSIHSAFDKTQEDNTKRIISGLSHPRAIILGHPTGRILNYRESISADWNRIFKFCQQNNKIVEINAYPDRLDLSADLIRQAVTLGVKLIINTDSHDAKHLSHMKYGVWQAMKGYVTKKDIINTLSWKDLQSMLKLSIKK